MQMSQQIVVVFTRRRFGTPVKNTLVDRFDQLIRFFDKERQNIFIDIMYLDGRGRIVEAYEMTKEPPRAESESELAYEYRLKHYSSRAAALFAIELKPGSMKRLNLKKGQRITLDLAKLRRIVIEEERKERERERELERGETGGGARDGDGGDDDDDGDS